MSISTLPRRPIASDLASSTWSSTPLHTISARDFSAELQSAAATTIAAETLRVVAMRAGLHSTTAIKPEKNFECREVADCRQNMGYFLPKLLSNANSTSGSLGGTLQVSGD